MRYYVFAADNAGDLIYEFITCENCAYFRKAGDLENRYCDSCMHPGGMVRPFPSGFCGYASFKPREEEQDNEAVHRVDQ